MAKVRTAICLGLTAAVSYAVTGAQEKKPSHGDPAGTYMFTWGYAAGGMGKDGDLPGGLKNEPIDTDKIQSMPWALELEKQTHVEDDPALQCLPTGPFRMQMTSGNYFEMLPTKDRIVMVFQVVDQGQTRRIFMDSAHPAKLYPTWNGDSRGHWEGEDLVVDTIGFNDKTWLAGSGIRHSEELHMVERFHWALDGAYIQYTNTVEDGKAFKGSFSYVRIYKKLVNENITEYVCNENPIPPLDETYNPNGLKPKPTFASKRTHPEGTMPAGD